MISASTRALWRKDRLWLAAFAIAGSIASLAVALPIGIEPLLVVPGQVAYDALGLCLWIAAALLGAFAAVREDLWRTRAYLLGRDLSPRREFWTRALTCLALLTLWLALPIALLLLHDVVLGGGAQALDLAGAGPALLGVWLQAAAIGAACLWALSLPVGVAGRTAVAALAVATLHVLATVTTGQHGEPQPWRTLVVLGGASALVLGLAARHAHSAPDPDLPLPRRFALAVAIAAAAAAAAGLFVTAALQQEVVWQLAQARPAVVEVAPDRLVLAGAPAPELAWQRPIVDGAHHPTGATLPAGLDRHAFVTVPTGDVWHVPDILQRAWVQPRLAVAAAALGNGGRRLLRFDPARGLAAVDLTALGRRTVALPRPDGRAFSRHASVHTVGEYASLLTGTLFVGDRADGSLWRLRDDPDPHLEAAALPEGDRFLGFVSERTRVEASTETGSRWRTAVVGAAHTWRLDGNAFTGQPQANADGDPAPAVTVLDGDLLTPELEVRSTGGAALRHRFAWHTWRETLLGSAVVAGSLLRSPLSALATLAARPDPASPWAWTVDGVVAHGRGELVAMVVALHLALAMATRWWLRRRHAVPARANAWAAAVGVGGVFVLALLPLLEPARAYRTPPERVGPGLILRSA